MDIDKRIRIVFSNAEMAQLTMRDVLRGARRLRNAIKADLKAGLVDLTDPMQKYAYKKANDAAGAGILFCKEGGKAYHLLGITDDTTPISEMRDAFRKYWIGRTIAPALAATGGRAEYIQVTAEELETLKAIGMLKFLTDPYRVCFGTVAGWDSRLTGLIGRLVEEKRAGKLIKYMATGPKVRREAAFGGFVRSAATPPPRKLRQPRQAAQTQKEAKPTWQDVPPEGVAQVVIGPDAVSVINKRGLIMDVPALRSPQEIWEFVALVLATKSTHLP